MHRLPGQPDLWETGTDQSTFECLCRAGNRQAPACWGPILCEATSPCMICDHAKLRAPSDHCAGAFL
eukprot:8402226-Lingulodinium_polyedra.AAC.1